MTDQNLPYRFLRGQPLNSQVNLIQLSEFVDIETICCSGFALLLDPLWKMPYHFFQIFSLGL